MKKYGKLKPEEKQLFRYLVVSQVLMNIEQGMSRNHAIKTISEKEHVAPNGAFVKLSLKTIQRWVNAFEVFKLEGLKDKERKKSKDSKVLPKRFLEYLQKAKVQDPKASIPELIRRAKEAGALHQGHKVDRSTTWRAMKRMGLPTRISASPAPRDQRPFAFKERMQMVLADFVHFRAGLARLKRVAIYLLDDATRFGINVLVSTGGEQAIVCLKLLHDTLLRFGLMLAVYWDRGSAFKSDDVARVMMNLGIHVVIGEAAYPEGRGKIERFNRSLRPRTLGSFDGAPDIDPDPVSLTLRLRHDLFHIYNQLPHRGIDNETPQDRWDRSTKPLVPVQDEEWLNKAFVLPMPRRVTKHNVIPYNSIFYEMPLGYARQRVTIERALVENDALYFLHNGQRIQLRSADLAFNAICGRSKRKKIEEVSSIPSKTSSTLSYEKHFSPITDPDGGFKHN
jgi:transposase InsO family protein